MLPHIWPYFIRSGGCLIPRESPPRTMFFRQVAFRSIKWILCSLVHASDISLSSSTFQYSSIFSPTIHPVMYVCFWWRRCTSAEKEMILLSACTVGLWVHVMAMKSFVIHQKSFLASASSRVESSWCGVGEETPSDSPRKLSCSSPHSGRSRFKVDVLRRCSPPQTLTVPSATGNMKFPHHCGVSTSFALSLFLSRFPMRPSPPNIQCLPPYCLLDWWSLDVSFV